MLYSNCLNIVQSFIAQGKLEFWAGPGAAARDRDLVVVLLFSASALGCSDCSSRPATAMTAAAP